jgi:(E)-4-hydroxy-3-methylbut-2-enyl-diphosphate synthase
VRVNPGNIRKFDDQVGAIAKAAKDAGVSLRIGVNAGSLDKRLLEKYGKATPRRSSRAPSGRPPVRGARLPRLQDLGQAQRPGRHGEGVPPARRARRLAAAPRCHRGGAGLPGHDQERDRLRHPAVEGIGDTIRVSLSAPPAEEVKVGHQILQSLNLRERKLEIVSCPSCGRAQVDVYTLADNVTEGLKDMTVPLRVAVMGCVVNGPGEAREADLGVASGNGKGQIFVKGEVIKTVPEAEIVATLIEEANRIADEMGPDAPLGTAQVVTA